MKINPFEHSNPMSWKDAVKVSVVLTLAIYFTTFLTLWGFHTIQSDVSKFCYDSFVFLGGGILTQFIVLAGLAKFTDSDDE